MMNASEHITMKTKFKSRKVRSQIATGAWALMTTMTTLATLGTALQAQAGTTTNVEHLLAEADQYRMSGQNMQVQVQIEVRNPDETLDKERTYTVFAQEKHQSLVIMQSPAEKGQKVLMLGDDFWLLMPNTQRPMRITPMQKLLGDASTGDLASLTWAGDYSGTLSAEEHCADNSKEICLHLSLKARRSAVTYARIELWLGKQQHEPVRADFYVQSERIAKRVNFVMDKAAAPTRVTEMVMQDELGNHKKTHMHFLTLKDLKVPEIWLNPMYLVKNPNLE